MPAAEVKLAQAEQTERQARADLDQATAAIQATAVDVAEKRRSAAAELRIAQAAARTAAKPTDTTPRRTVRRSTGAPSCADARASRTCRASAAASRMRSPPRLIEALAYVEP